MHWMTCSLYFLGCVVVNIGALFAEWSITERDVTTFRYCCLGFFLAWNPLFIFSTLDAVMAAFHGFGKYIFPQRQTCTALSAGCTECSCSPNILIFNNFLILTFLFLISNKNFLFPGKVFPLHFWYCTPLSTSSIPLNS